jgi:DNA invertase Pin-like site-specific DNA recombinase
MSLLSNPNQAIKIAAIYARVSTDPDKPRKNETKEDAQKRREEAQKRKQEVENQLRQLREYCQRQGWTIAHEYIDHVSGKRADNRKDFQRMFADASQRQFDVVVVWALDRFTREGVHQTFDHIRTLSQYGVQFESFTEPHFRTTGPAGELMIAVAAWIAKQERIRISERTKAGMERVKASGKHVGRPQKIVSRDKIRQLAAQGMGVRRIAQTLGDIAPVTVYRILKGRAA